MTWEGTAGGWDLSPRESSPFTPLSPRRGSCRERMFTQWSWQERRYSLCPEGRLSQSFPQCHLAPEFCWGPILSVSRYWAFRFLFCLFLVQRFPTGTPQSALLCLKHQQSPPGKLPKETAISSSPVEFPLITPDSPRRTFTPPSKACLMPCTFTLWDLLFKSRNCKAAISSNFSESQKESQPRPTITIVSLFSFSFALEWALGCLSPAWDAPSGTGRGPLNINAVITPSDESWS